MTAQPATVPTGTGWVPTGTPAASSEPADEGELIPDVEEPWLPALSSRPLVLATSAVAVFAALAALWGNTSGPLAAATHALLAVVLVFLSVIDWVTLRLPNVLVLPLYPILGAATVAAGFTGQAAWGSVLTAFECMAGVWAVYWITAAVTGGVGWGDVKLSGVLGLVLGLQGFLPALIGALLLPMALGGLVGLPLLMTGRHKVEMPFGPFLATGALAVLILPNVIIPFLLGIHH